MIPTKISIGSKIVARCPKCGRVERFSVTGAQLHEIEVSGISNIAFDHVDHILIIAFDIWGSIRGQYVYKKASKGGVSEARVDAKYQVKKIEMPDKMLEETVSLVFINRVDKSVEIWGDLDIEIEKLFYRNFLLIEQVEKTLKSRYEVIKISSEKFYAYMGFSEKFGIALISRERLDKDLEKDVMAWLIDAIENLDILFRYY